VKIVSVTHFFTRRRRTINSETLFKILENNGVNRDEAQSEINDLEYSGYVKIINDGKKLFIKPIKSREEFEIREIVYGLNIRY
jgi:hypothetical protein